jgi:cytochrome c-type biogenesis protein CcmH/NrfG
LPYYFLPFCFIFCAPNRHEDKAERQEIRRQMEAERKEIRRQMAADRETDKAEKAAAQKEMRVTAFVNISVALLTAFSSMAYTIFEISKQF